MARLMFFMCFLILSACHGEVGVPKDLYKVRADLAFTCTQEASHLPSLDPDADMLFLYGLYLETRDGPKNFDDVARYYRIAAAHDHYKANHNVQLLVFRGMAGSPNAAKEAVGWAERLVDKKIPVGYCDIGYYLNSGYGLKENKELALKFIRKAADLGNPGAQYYVSELLAHHGKAPDVSRVMLECAANQGHARAAYELGIALELNGKYSDAVISYQKAVAAGNGVAGLFLQQGFLNPPKDDRMYFLDLPRDLERSRRYEEIRKFLGDNELSNPKVPDIDRIVPLPPAKLPPWDGTFEWEKLHKRSLPKPSDELINRMARERNLDPATGLPLTPDVEISPVRGSARMPLGTTAKTGDRCPESGVWCALMPAEFRANKTQFFEKGDVMPMLDFYKPRVVGILDRIAGERRRTGSFWWKLVDYVGAI